MLVLQSVVSTATHGRLGWCKRWYPQKSPAVFITWHTQSLIGFAFLISLRIRRVTIKLILLWRWRTKQTSMTTSWRQTLRRSLSKLKAVRCISGRKKTISFKVLSWIFLTLNLLVDWVINKLWVAFRAESQLSAALFFRWGWRISLPNSPLNSVIYGIIKHQKRFNVLN